MQVVKRQSGSRAQFQADLSQELATALALGLDVLTEPQGLDTQPTLPALLGKPPMTALGIMGKQGKRLKGIIGHMAPVVCQ